MNQRAVITIAMIVLVVAALAGAAVWYLGWWVPSPPAEVSPTIGGDIYEKVQNPLKGELPEVNPFEAQTNPFEKAETNPFIGSYENPFD